MESMFKPPQPLSLDGNISENWKNFAQKFELFAEATDLYEKSEAKKCAVFLSLIGDDGLDLFNSFTFGSGEDAKKLNDIKKKFQEYCSPKKNVTFERFMFNSIVQKENQPFDSFVTELRKAVKTTEYKDQDDMIRDRVVIGLYDKNTQERLLREAKLSLDKVINLCRATEVSKNQSKLLAAEVTLHAVKAGNKKKCGYCGYSHPPKKCPAYKKTCAKCQGLHHFATMCKRAAASSEITTAKDSHKKKKIDEIAHATSSADEVLSDEFSIDAVTKLISVEMPASETRKIDHVQRSVTKWMEQVNVDGTTVQFKLDCGAEVSVLPREIFQVICGKAKLKKTDVVLVSYGNSDFKVKPLGEVILKCKVKDKVAFFIIDVRNQI